MTVSRTTPQKAAPVEAQRVAVPPPHAPVVPKPTLAAQPRSAPPHPRVLHELAKNTPKGPPNPTPAPVSSAAPNPVPTQAEIAVTPAPIPAAVPTTLPATVVAVSIKAPPTAAPLPKPSAVPTVVPKQTQPLPTAVPRARLVTPVPEPSALEATAAPLVAQAPQAVVTPGVPSPGPVKAPAPAKTAGTSASPGPKAVGSPGPHGVAPVKGPAVSRPIQSPATPRPAAPAGGGAKRAKSLNQRLQSLIPTAAPSVSPQPAKHYSFLSNLKPTPEPEPTPPPDVLAATKYLYIENVGSERWKHWPLGSAPEEIYVKMYVTSMHRVGPVNWCTGWVLRAPVAGAHRWIVEPNESFICAGHLEPFTAPVPLPTGTP